MLKITNHKRTNSYYELKMMSEVSQYKNTDSLSILFSNFKPQILQKIPKKNHVAAEHSFRCIWKDENYQKALEIWHLNINGDPDRLVCTIVADGSCRLCGCTDDNCRQCIAKTGGPCQWVEPDLCSACDK